MADIYQNFCQGTHTDPIDRPKPAIFLLAAFGIGFSKANIPQWCVTYCPSTLTLLICRWHRLLPPQTRCILGAEGHEEPVVEGSSTRPRTNVTNAARARARTDTQNVSFWESSAPIFERFFGEGGPAPAPDQAVSAQTCVSVMQVLNSEALDDDERRLRRAAVVRLTAMLERPMAEMPPSQRQRVSQRQSHDD